MVRESRFALRLLPLHHGAVQQMKKLSLVDATKLGGSLSSFDSPARPRTMLSSVVSALHLAYP